MISWHSLAQKIEIEGLTTEDKNKLNATSLCFCQDGVSSETRDNVPLKNLAEDIRTMAGSEIKMIN